MVQRLAHTTTFCWAAPRVTTRSNTTTLVINAKTHNTATVNGVTGSDEVWFNSGDRRYYLGASKAIKPAGSTLGSGAVLGVVDGTSVLIETIPQSSNSHSVAAELQAQPDLRSAGSVRRYRR